MENKVYLIGNGHLDPVWQWQVPEGLALIKSTFKAALDRMKEYPDYVFTSACAGYYKWIKLSEPEMFEEIKQKIKEGKWIFTGGMWVQPDCNIPCGESFARQFLYSQKFFKENFGNISKTGYNVDSFGHNGMLPQLFKLSGIDNYVYQRPSRDLEKPSLPECNLHWWESPDGSRVLAFRIALSGYGDEFTEEDANKEKFQKFVNAKIPQMLYYGVGNHGGGPSIRSLDFMEKRRKEMSTDRIDYSSPDKYFEDMRKIKDKLDLPTVSDDLQHHASGCYSANAKIKEMNRRAENELIYAEKIGVMSTVLTKSHPISEKIEEAWERVMFNQFHDILAGCSIKPAYTDAYNAYGFASETALGVGAYAAERITWRVNTTKFLDSKPSEKRDRLWIKEGEGSPMVVFNPHSFPIKTTVSFGCQWVSGVVDSDDNETAFQLVRATYTDGRHINKCLFEVTLPAYGYATYFIFKEDQNYQPKPVENTLVVTENTLENSKIKVTIDKVTGNISSFYDKELDKEYAAGPMAKAIIEEDSHTDTWAHKIFDFNNDIGVFSDAKLEVLEKGPIRAAIKVTTTYNRSTLSQYFTLYKDSKKLDVRCKLNFNEHYKIAKLAFKVNIDNPKAVYSMPFGFIEKEPNGEEEPAQGWIDVRDENGMGVALLNDSKHSFSIKDNEMRMIMARGCAYLDHYGQDFRDGEIDFIDQGEHEFNYALMMHDTCDYTDVVKETELMNMPAHLYMETHHQGDLPAVYGGISVDAENVIVQAIKHSEDKKGIVLRTFETSGKAVKATIDFSLIGRKFTFEWKEHEIKTIYIPLDGSEVREILIIEQ